MTVGAHIKSNSCYELNIMLFIIGPISMLLSGGHQRSVEEVLEGALICDVLSLYLYVCIVISFCPSYM